MAKLAYGYAWVSLHESAVCCLCQKESAIPQDRSRFWFGTCGNVSRVCIVDVEPKFYRPGWSARRPAVKKSPTTCKRKQQTWSPLRMPGAVAQDTATTQRHVTQ